VNGNASGIWKICFFALSVGLLVMIASNVFAKTFKLKAPNQYFANEKTQFLLAAALGGNLAEAQRQVTGGANPNEEGPQSNKYNRLRLLHYAIAARNQRAVDVLLKVGADPELIALGYGTAFDFAMTLDDIEMLSFMFDIRAVSTLSYDTVKTLILEAVSTNRPRCLELIIKRGVPVDLPDSAGYTAMMRAIDAQDYEMAEWLLLQGASVHIVAKSGMTPAYSIEYDLRKYKIDSPSYKKVQHLMKLMQERGAKFPATAPAEMREKRANAQAL
jgi:ankyrin repeat protein